MGNLTIVRMFSFRNSFSGHCLAMIFEAALNGSCTVSEFSWGETWCRFGILEGWHGLPGCLIDGFDMMSLYARLSG